MANKKSKEENVRNTPTSSESGTKIVHNRGNGKIELLINNEVVVFPPKGNVKVPKDFEVPSGIGLYVR